MKRAVCPACERPEKVCLCDWIKKIDNSFPITVLRHKSESGHALNTVNILQKSLLDIKVIDGEIFDEGLIPDNSYLVYPSDDAQDLGEIDIPNKSNFILLDGSWKKTRKITYLNPWLEKIPKLKLPFQQSRYFLRKQKENGFSTLEAVHYILSTLENDKDKYQSLLECLDQMMNLQSKHIHPEVVEKHFGDRLR